MTETIAKAESPENELFKNALSRAGSLKQDWLTAAALGLLAMCMEPFDHEALGHGGCLLLGGHIRLLTTSLFQCDVSSKWLVVNICPYLLPRIASNKYG